MASFIPASRTASILVVCQLVSLMSLLAWGAIASMILRSNHALDVAGTYFAFYPVLPVGLSLVSWFAYKLRRQTVAIVLSALPATLALVLMIYYFIIGVMSHAA